MSDETPASVRLYLVRHGETEWSITRQHTGRTEVGLTARGEDDARELGRHLRKVAFARVFTSPRRRARRTCALAALPPAAEIDQDLAEWNYGEYEGHRTEEIRRGYPGWNLFRDGCPHGESPELVTERVDRLLARLRSLSGNVALFTHCHFGSVLAARWLGLPIAEAEHFPLDTASISILADDAHHPGVPVLALWNGGPSGGWEAPGAPPTLGERAVDRWENEGGET